MSDTASEQLARVETLYPADHFVQDLAMSAIGRKRDVATIDWNTAVQVDFRPTSVDQTSRS